MASKPFVFRFGDVEVREREFSLTKAGEVLAVEPKAFRVLLMLLRNPQKLISKEELLNAVWGDAAVTENSLTRSIALLRRLLGDEARDPRFIETVATVGYRWISKVEVSEEGSGEPEAAEAPVGLGSAGKKDGNRKRLRGWVLAGGGVLALCIAGGIWYLHRPLPPPRITGITQITHDGHQKILVGTDGSRLYFNQVWGLESPGSIAQVATSGGEIAQVPVALPEPYLRDVSPDGSSFLLQSGPTLWNVRILGGSVRPLPVAESAAFSPDGNSVAYTSVDGDNWGGIYLVRSDGTGAHKLASAGDEVSDIAWSPDGGVIRFTMKDKIWEISSNGSNLHQLLPGWHVSYERCCGRWTPDGRFFLFLSEGQIWALDERRGLFRRPPVEPIQLTQGPIRWGGPLQGGLGPGMFWGGPVPSKDGTRIFAHGATPHGELSRFDAKTKQFQPFLGGISAQGVVFSSDGKSIAYVSFPEGILWKANRDGSNPVQLSYLPVQACLPRWSPDGTQILFMDISTYNSLGHATSYVVSSDGGSPRKLLQEDQGSLVGITWSPDGRKIVCSSTSAGEEGGWQILDLDNRQVKTVPGSKGLGWPRWSPDGRYLVADPYLKILDFKTQQWSQLPQKGSVDSPEWSRDSQFIYFKRLRGDLGLFRIRVRGGGGENIADLKDWHDAGWWGAYMGLDPTDAPLLLRDIGSDDIYALTLEEK